eukprot:3526788-Rhodomonas_salina.1
MSLHPYGPRLQKTVGPHRQPEIRGEAADSGIKHAHPESRHAVSGEHASFPVLWRILGSWLRCERYSAHPSSSTVDPSSSTVDPSSSTVDRPLSVAIPKPLADTRNSSTA